MRTVPPRTKQICIAVPLCPVPWTAKPGSPTLPVLADPEPSSPSPPEFPHAPQVPSGSACGGGRQPWPPGGVGPGRGAEGPASVHLCPHGWTGPLGERLSQDQPARRPELVGRRARGTWAAAGGGSGRSRGMTGDPQGGTALTRVACVCVCLHVCGPPRVCPCDRERPRTKRASARATPESESAQPRRRAP